jgi:hypothetical protein
MCDRTVFAIRTVLEKHKLGDQTRGVASAASDLIMALCPKGSTQFGKLPDIDFAAIVAEVANVAIGVRREIEADPVLWAEIVKANEPKSQLGLQSILENIFGGPVVLMGGRQPSDAKQSGPAAPENKNKSMVN